MGSYTESALACLTCQSSYKSPPVLATVWSTASGACEIVRQMAAPVTDVSM